MTRTLGLTLYLILILNSLGFGLSPSKLYVNTPDKFKLTYETIDIQSNDGVSLKAWYFPEDNSEYLVIISHNGVGNMGNYLERIKRLKQYGFSILSYDYRGFGGSSNFEIDPSNYIYQEFYTDLENVINYCSANFDKQIISYGWGVGASLAICNGYSHPKVTGIIADDSFVDIYELRGIFKTKKLAMKLPDQVLAEKYSPIHNIALSPGSDLRGILLLQGQKNYILEEGDQRRLLVSSKLSNTELYQFKSSPIMNTFKKNESEYIRQIYLFVMNL